jgi:hypothetical protein
VAKRPTSHSSSRSRRRVRIQQVLFTVLGLLIVASFVLSMMQ